MSSRKGHRSAPRADAAPRIVASDARSSRDVVTARRRRRRLLASALCAAALGSMLATGRSAWRAHAREARAQQILTLDEGGYRYAFQVLTGDEALYDLANDPHELRNLAPSQAERVTSMRRTLAERLHVKDLRKLSKHDEETARILRSLGYL